jgi:hypothetical protein
MAKAAFWLAGYVLGAWAWWGLTLFVAVSDRSAHRMMELLVCIVLPSSCALAMRRRNHPRPLHPFLGGVAIGGVASTVFVLLLGALFLSVAGFWLFVFLVLDPRGGTVFFLVPPVLVAVHGLLTPTCAGPGRGVTRRAQ